MTWDAEPLFLLSSQSMRGAGAVIAIDIDDWCVNNSRDNIKLNHIDNITVELGDASLLANKQPFDVIIANINRNILLNDMAAYANCMHSGSEIYMSGFYVQDIQAIPRKSRKFRYGVCSPSGKKQLGCS